MKKYLKESPSLRRYLDSEFLSAYQDSKRIFIEVTRVNLKNLPEKPEFTLEQALDVDWFPAFPKNKPQPDESHSSS